MANLKISQLTPSAPLTGTEELPLVQSGQTVKATAQDIANLAGGGGLSGTSYVFVAGDGTPTQNGTALIDAYNQAKLMSPSSTNRVTVVVAPGKYTFSSPFIMDTQYIDMVSLTGYRDVIVSRTGDPFTFDPITYYITNFGQVIEITANNIHLKGIKSDTINSPNWNSFWGDPNFKLPMFVTTNLPGLVVENCEAGSYSFGAFQYNDVGNTFVLNGTFINTEAGYVSFGSDENNTGNTITVSGIFTDCVVTESRGFGGGGGAIVSGTFTNCKAKQGSFGYLGVASGTFINCTAGNNSFGSFTTSGSFYNCIAENNCFIGTASGSFYNCIGMSGVFGATASGVFIDCVANDNAFGQSTASGTFRNCSSLANSFGSSTLASGNFYNCIATSTSFGGVGTFSGMANNCVAANSSFGVASLTGKLYYCRMTSSVFPTVGLGGITRYCIDGSNNTNNQG